MDIITGFHGTKDLEGIFQEGGILPPFWREHGQTYWVDQKRKYDQMCTTFASALKGAAYGLEVIAYYRKLWPELSEDKFEEVLAECYVKKMAFGEQKKFNGKCFGLTVCVSPDLRYALPYEGFAKDKVGAIFQLHFSQNLVRPTNDSVIYFMGKVELRYVQQIIAFQDNIPGVAILLRKYHCEIPLREWSDTGEITLSDPENQD